MDTTLGLAQHYCEMHDYISKYIYSDIGYDCQVLFEEGFWEKIGSAVKTAWKQITKFLAMIWDKAVNLVTNLFGKSRKVFNELSSETLKWISEMIDWCQKVTRKESNNEEQAGGLSWAENIVETLCYGPTIIYTQEMLMRHDLSDTEDSKLVAEYNKNVADNDKAKNKEDVKSKIAEHNKNANLMRSKSLRAILTGNLLRISKTKPDLHEVINSKQLKKSEYNYKALKNLKVNDCCDKLDKLKEWYEDEAFPSNPAFFNELGTLNDVGGKYLHYLDQFFILLSKGHEINDQEQKKVFISDLQKLTGVSSFDDTKEISTQVLSVLGTVGSKSSIADMLNKMNSILNEAVNTLKNNLGKVETNAKNYKNEGDKSINDNNLKLFQDYKLDTRYKATDIDSKGDPGIIKFNKEQYDHEEDLPQIFRTFGLTTMQQNLGLTLTLINRFRYYFVTTHEAMKKYYEDTFKKEIKDDYEKTKKDEK